MLNSQTPRPMPKPEQRLQRRLDAAMVDRAAAMPLLLTKKAAAAAQAYRREQHLPQVLPLWPREIADKSRAGTEAILKKLQSALRAERRRGKAGRWSYDLNRHMALLAAYKAERSYCRTLPPAPPAVPDATNAGHPDAAGAIARRNKECGPLRPQP